MSDDRADADRLSDEYVANIYDYPDQHYAVAEAYFAGYLTACESKRAEIEEYKNNYLNACQTVAAMHEAATGLKSEGPKRGVVEDVADVRAALEAERARSSKLIHMLEAIDRRAGSASQKSGWTDAIEVAEWARRAIAEYEAGRGN